MRLGLRAGGRAEGWVEVMALAHILEVVPGAFTRSPPLRDVSSLTLVTDRTSTFERLVKLLGASRVPVLELFDAFVLQVGLCLYRYLRPGTFRHQLAVIKVIHREVAGVHVTDSHAWWPVNVDGVSRWPLMK